MTSARNWVGAARPKTLPAAVGPVLVGSGLAVHEGGFRIGALVAAMIGALAIQVAANFANDASDAARGADPEERVGPTRMVASGLIAPRRMWLAVWTSVTVAAVAGVYLIATAGWVVAVIGIVSILAMLTYVGGPIPYGYRGLGELSVFIFFGLVATVGTRYVHDRAVSASAWWLGIVMGMLAAAILVANNLRDIETDAATGKRTLAVILGKERTRTFYTCLVVVAFVLVAAGAVLGITPALTGTSVAWFGLAVPLIAKLRSDGATLIGVLGGTARLQLLVALSLAATAAVS